MAAKKMVPAAQSFIEVQPQDEIVAAGKTAIRGENPGIAVPAQPPLDASDRDKGLPSFERIRCGGSRRRVEDAAGPFIGGDENAEGQILKFAARLQPSGRIDDFPG
ncbi:MAG: hypothetical protein FJY80_12100, partial [Candidatus Aminicenantes bacterium]|nr:hypothetical protein [Candidatus Aminicenantes bacterium]